MNMTVARLSAEQAAAFDREFQTAEEVAAQVAFIRKTWPDRLSILDVGGGNGVFADRLLAELPYATVTVLDPDEGLLAENVHDPRKQIIMGGIEHAAGLLEGQSFDVVFFNLVLHHLVDETYATTRANCLQALTIARRLLKPGGMIAVTEIDTRGVWLWSPGWLIYQITRIKHPAFARLAAKHFNTAGVGVAFRSADGWRSVFHDAGLEERWVEDGPVWGWDWRFIGLGLTMRRHRHTFLYAARKASLTLRRIVRNLFDPMADWGERPPEPCGGCGAVRHDVGDMAEDLCRPCATRELSAW